MHLLSKLAFGALCVFTAPALYAAENPPLPAGQYQLDQSHASLVFSASHLGFSQYTMSFDRFDASLQIDPAHPENAQVKATVDPTSLDLPSPPEGFLNEVMNGASWLNAKAFPAITFTSRKVVMTGEKTAIIEGELELLGVKKPITLQATFNGGYTGHPMDPKARIGFSAQGTFKRSDFGMTYGIPAPGTTMGVGDEITVAIEAEFSGPPMPNAPKK